nr:MAG TPA: hypothetical protein [Caudoviricetes sp.]DAR90891.1 MAG TPA: hypothetical protein [Caudoviricetes sp.]DAS98572.1 MAG TPA: hypothetical protein [Caudoviricetes sp.]
MISNNSKFKIFLKKTIDIKLNLNYDCVVTKICKK